MPSDDLAASARNLVDALRRRGLRIAAAESCTGGLVAATLTEVAGASDVVDRGFVTYTNAAKVEMLGVPSDLIAAVGAVSRDVAVAMAEGALARSAAEIAVAVTGLAGPGGGTAAKPVGLVHVACARHGGPTLHRELRLGPLDRRTIRERAVAAALALAAEGAQAAPAAPAAQP